MIAADLELRSVTVQAHVLRYEAATPVRTSFGLMRARPAVLVRTQDASGVQGWGEVWCNFPPCGAEHRAKLVETALAPLLAGARFASPHAVFDYLSEATAVLAIQAGEPGPFAQAIAGVDLALWDLVARRQGQPLWRVLGGRDDTVGVYASGINPEQPERTVQERRRDGYRAFKLKVGFGPERDLDNIGRVVEAAGDGATVMVDANQGWDLQTACDMVRRLARFELSWIEEPLRADRPWSEWTELRRHASAALAAGENLLGELAFDALLACGAVDVVQPDVAKWGGISGCWGLSKRIRQAGRRYFPHFLGAGIGLLHSAHLLAARGSNGLLEVDSNPNPLRSLLCGRINEVRDGSVSLGEAPGIGIEPNLDELREICEAGACLQSGRSAWP